MLIVFAARKYFLSVYTKSELRQESKNFLMKYEFNYQLTLIRNTFTGQVLYVLAESKST